MSYIYFTEEQKRRANKADLVEFLRRQGEKQARSGPEYQLTSDHSCNILYTESWSGDWLRRYPPGGRSPCFVK